MGVELIYYLESFVEILEIVKIVAAILLFVVWLIPIPFCLFGGEDRSDANITWGLSSLWSFVLLGICYLLLS